MATNADIPCSNHHAVSRYTRRGCISHFAQASKERGIMEILVTLADYCETLALVIYAIGAGIVGITVSVAYVARRECEKN